MLRAPFRITIIGLCRKGTSGATNGARTDSEPSDQRWNAAITWIVFVSDFAWPWFSEVTRALDRIWRPHSGPCRSPKDRHHRQWSSPWTRILSRLTPLRSSHPQRRRLCRRGGKLFTGRSTCIVFFILCYCQHVCVSQYLSYYINSFHALWGATRKTNIAVLHMPSSLAERCKILFCNLPRVLRTATQSPLR